MVTVGEQSPGLSRSCTGSSLAAHWLQQQHRAWQLQIQVPPCRGRQAGGGLTVADRRPGARPRSGTSSPAEQA
jgi:hypothetical protein